MSKKLSLVLLVLVLGVLGFFVSTTPQETSKVYAQVATSTYSIGPWAWADTIGWISMQSGGDLTCDPNNNGVFQGNAEGAPSGCPTSGTAYDYGVDISSSGIISGYGWSEHVGWVSFNETSGCPTGTCQARVVNGKTAGWAKIISGDDSSTDGWDGWISLSGQVGDSYPNYGLDFAIGSGYAWGGDPVTGWILLTGSMSDVDMCTNITGTQTTVPTGTTRDSNGACNCDNGSDNPPSCTLSCPDGVSTNYPQCNNGNGSPCSNGASNPPDCNNAGKVCTPVITAASGQRSIASPTTNQCVFTYTVRNDDDDNPGDAAPFCDQEGLECSINSGPYFPVVSEAPNTLDLSIGTHRITCRNIEGNSATLIPFPQCRLAPSYGEF